MTRMIACRVSIIVRSIGRATLARALASIAAQGYPATEVVVVAASGRAHPPIVSACGPYPVRAVLPTASLPRAEAADAGIRAATGDWISFLDDDDELLPGHIAGLVASTDGNPWARAVTCRALATFRDGRAQVWGQRFALAELYARNFVHLSTLLFHRSLLEQGIAFDRNLPLHEDWDFALQIAQHTQFADWAAPTFCWHADAGTSGAGGGDNVDSEAFARHRGYIYAKWAPTRDALIDRCAELMRDAMAAATAGRLDAAMAAAHDVLAISQNDPHALNLLSMLALRQGDSIAALAHQALAVEVRPHDPDLVFNLALVHVARGEFAGARAALAHALELDPAHPRAAAKLREIDATSTGAVEPRE